MKRRAFATALVGQCSLLREGLSRILSTASSPFRIVASVPTIDGLAMEPAQPDLLIIDSGNDPRALAKQIDVFKQRQSAGRVAVLADQYVVPLVLSAFRAGANAYLLKDVTSDAFTKALELVMLGETILPSELLSYVGNAAHTIDDVAHTSGLEIAPDRPPSFDPIDLPKLSAREEYILRYIGEGYPNKLIARKMGIAEGTVKVHVKAILRKIRVGNRTQAAIWLMNNPAHAQSCGVAQTPAKLSIDRSTSGVDPDSEVVAHPPAFIDHQTAPRQQVRAR